MLPSSLKLTIVACHGKALANGTGAVFDVPGGTIGSDAGNTLLLSDNEGIVARRHAAVRAKADGWQLFNTSENTAITVNGKLLAPGEQTGLQAGDIVNIGPYVLQVAAGALLPTWNLPSVSADPTFKETPHNLAPDADASNPPHKATLATSYRGDPLAAIDPSTTLDDLLDTPLDPLALFGTPTRGWSGSGWDDPAWSEASASGLLADLVSRAPSEAFDTPHPGRASGHAIRDDVPEFLGHLRLKIAPQPEVSAPDKLDAPVPDRDTASVSAALPVAKPASLRGAGIEQAHYGDAFGQLHNAPTCVVRVAAPHYSGKLHMKAETWHDGSLEASAPLLSPADHKPFQPVLDAREARVSAANAAFESHAMLAQAFLEGSGVASDEFAEAGFTPEFMRTLGMLVRTLRQ